MPRTVDVVRRRARSCCELRDQIDREQEDEQAEAYSRLRAPVQPDPGICLGRPRVFVRVHDVDVSGDLAAVYERHLMVRRTVGGTYTTQIPLHCLLGVMKVSLRRIEVPCGTYIHSFLDQDKWYQYNACVAGVEY